MMYLNNVRLMLNIVINVEEIWENYLVPMA